MSPHSLGGTGFNSYDHNDGRYRVKPRNTSRERFSKDDKYGALRWGQGDRLYPESGNYLEDYRATGRPQYVDETLSRDDQERLRQRTDPNARPKHRESFQRTADSDGFDLDSLSSAESDEEKKVKLSRLLATDETVSVEDQIRIRTQKLFEETLTREKQKEAGARENEEYWKEADARYKVALQKALNDQAAAFQKQVENQKHATQVEMERLRQKEESDETRFKKAVATKVEADRKAERERACKIREKLERDKIEEERRKEQAAQDAEELYTARLKQEADRLVAERKAEEDKMTAENTANVFELTRLLISIFEANEARGDTNVSKNTNSKKLIVLGDVPRELLVQVKKILDEKPESSVDEQKAVVEAEQVSKVQETSLKSKGKSKSNVKAESLHVRVKQDNCFSRDAAKHKNKTSSAKTRERGRREMHAEKAKDGRVHGKHKDQQKEEKVSKRSQDRARAAMRWFISA